MEIPENYLCSCINPIIQVWACAKGFIALMNTPQWIYPYRTCPPRFLGVSYRLRSLSPASSWCWGAGCGFVSGLPDRPAPFSTQTPDSSQNGIDPWVAPSTGAECGVGSFGDSSPGGMKQNEILNMRYWDRLQHSYDPTNGLRMDGSPGLVEWNRGLESD